MATPSPTSRRSTAAKDALVSALVDDANALVAALDADGLDERAASVSGSVSRVFRPLADRRSRERVNAEVLVLKGL